MAERLDAVVAREYERNGEKKTSFTKIGTAFSMRNGGWSLILDALPLPQMGERGLETRILLMPPKQDRAPASSHPSNYSSQSGGGFNRDLDDGEMPF